MRAALLVPLGLVAFLLPVASAASPGPHLEGAVVDLAPGDTVAWSLPAERLALHVAKSTPTDFVVRYSGFDEGTGTWTFRGFLGSQTVTPMDGASQRLEVVEGSARITFGRAEVGFGATPMTAKDLGAPQIVQGEVAEGACRVHHLQPARGEGSILFTGEGAGATFELLHHNLTVHATRADGINLTLAAGVGPGAFLRVCETRASAAGAEYVLEARTPAPEGEWLAYEAPPAPYEEQPPRAVPAAGALAALAVAGVAALRRR